MKKTFFYLITLLTGILNGYILIICLGYMKSFELSINVMVWTIRLLEEYHLSILERLSLHILNAIDLVITATPIFLVFGLTLVYLIKLKRLIIGWISSIGILFIFVYATIRYDGAIISLLLDSVIIVSLNIYIIKKITNIVEAKTKA